MRTCPNCLAEQESAAQRCSGCGRPLEQLSPLTLGQILFPSAASPKAGGPAGKGAAPPVVVPVSPPAPPSVAAAAFAEIAVANPSPKELERRLVGKDVAGKFRVVELIGAGGMGYVFKALHLGLDKLVALKVLPPALMRDPQVIMRFEREAKSASRLNHPNSIHVLDFGFDGAAFYIAMEYVQGRELRVVFQEDFPLGERRVCQIMAEVLGALAEAHTAHVIHRDLKPANIMLVQHRDKPDFPKVLDFGIARIQPPGSTGLTQGELVTGTPEYMSPEQALAAEVDGRSDLYSVGVILFQLMTGQLPFIGRNAIETVQKQITEPPILPSKAAPDQPISPELDSLILRALSKDPNARPQSAEVFRRELLAIGARAPDKAAHAESRRKGSSPRRTTEEANAAAEPPKAAPPETLELADTSTLFLPPQRANPRSAVPEPARPGRPPTPASRSPSAPAASSEPAPVSSFLLALIAALSLAVVVLGWLVFDLRAERARLAARLDELSAARVPASSAPEPAPPGREPARAAPPKVAATAAVTSMATAPGTACPDHMRHIDLPGDPSPDRLPGYCIDTYEFPNRKGERPQSGITWRAAMETCQRQKKRLCTEAEWQRACAGSAESPLPYGETWDANACVVLSGQVEPAGAKERCESREGVFDLSGNVAEWTATREGSGRVVKGAGADAREPTPGLDPMLDPRCGGRVVVGTDEASPLRGFRCCRDAG